jgi:hypothetical protein
MVRDGVVRVPEHRRRVEHLLQGREPVGQPRVRVEVAPHLLPGEDLGQSALERGLHLSTVLAQRRRDPRQPETLVDLLLGPGDDQVSGLRVEEPVLVELQSLADGHLADPDVVGL